MDNSLTLAYIGDCVYELYIREYLINQGMIHVKELQQSSLEYVSAKSQRMHLEKLIDNNFLTEEELVQVKRGRNAKGGKNRRTDIVTYRLATGLETLIGYLYMNSKAMRIKEIMDYIVGDK